MKLLVATLLVLAGTVRADIKFDVDVMQHMETMFESRYPNEANKGHRENARDYIAERMKYYGLDVELQKFNTTVNTNPTGINSEQVLVKGTNVIGIKKAITEHPGAVVVVGADYDSNGVDNALFYNGGGVAALLEVARLYSLNAAWSGRFVANYTTVFVAFDINTKYHMNSPGNPGGKFFVHEWLWPFIKRNVDNFGGAIILDSVLNVNYEQNSQSIPGDFQQTFPDTYARLQEDNRKGDFLAMVSKGSSDDSTKLRDQFSGSYYKEKRMEPYRLEDMVIKLGVTFGDILQQFAHSETIHFWAFKDDTNITITLPALLLTDTRKLRPDPSIVCVSTSCRPKDLLTDERIAFVNATVKATTRFLFNRQATLLPKNEKDSAVTSLPSAFMTVVMLGLVRLYM